MIEFGFYTGTYHGASISAEDWPAFALQAEKQLDKYKRIYTVTALEEHSEAMAVCAMADAFAYFVAAQNGTAGAVNSASIGSVSVSYGSASGVDLSPKGQERELYRCACQHLDIYRGVGRCSC